MDDYRYNKILDVGKDDNTYLSPRWMTIHRYNKIHDVCKYDKQTASKGLKIHKLQQYIFSD